ncbi:MAG: Na+/H+ antiporter subunit E [Actinomycetales bacterium]|nr:Na+/H+ antiporter subunit E [Actinomycetales bacterium]
MSLHPRRRRTKLQWGAIFLLAAVWILLWGDVSWANLLGGLAVGILVTILLPLPPIDFHGRIRPGALLYMLGHFVWDLAVASVHVAALALNFRRKPRGAVVGVQLRNHSDLYLTITAELSTLTPGSLVVEAHRLTGMLYLHVLDIDSYGGAQKVREDTLALEERVLRAFASDAELLEAGLTVRPVLTRIKNGVNGKRGADEPEVTP